MATFSATFHLVEAELLAQKLGELPRAVASRLGRAVLREAGQPMVAAVKGGIHSVSGLLERSERLTAATNDRPGRIAMLLRAVTSRGEFLKATHFQRSTTAYKFAKAAQAGKSMKGRYGVYYALFVERGHRIVTSKGRVAGQVPAHPFARPGFEATQAAVVAAVERRLPEALQGIF